jgi:hypothetical protein
MDKSVLTAGMHLKTPLNIDLNINNESQDCKIGTVYLWGGDFWEGESERRRWS